MAVVSVHDLNYIKNDKYFDNSAAEDYNKFTADSYI
jgi:hypothetical protein